MQQTTPAPPVEAAKRPAVSPCTRQTALVAHFGAAVQWKDDLDALVREACSVAAEGIGAGFAGVLQYRADERAFVLQAGVGWPVRVIGRTRVAADLGTTAGLAWLTGQLVHFRRLDAIGRIRVPEAMTGCGVRCVASVPIHGECSEAFGVLEVGSAEVEEFTRDDLSFLQSLADSVARAVSLHARRTSRMERAELAAERRPIPGGGLGILVGRQGTAGTSYQQDAQVATG